MKNSANSNNVEGISKVGYFENPASGNFNTWQKQKNSRVTAPKVNNAKPCRFCGNNVRCLNRVCKKSGRAH